ncbi:MAG: creatininase family protein [Myxococcota bacterium]|nr:creatininase family protein [Myxococcota bacterium]
MPEPEILRWETLTKKRFDQIDRSQAVVMVTCSPLEVHGPHLPLGADCLEGEGLAERTLRHLPERHQARTFLKLPFVYAASDPVPQPGSIAFRPTTTQAVLEDLGRSLAAQGFQNVVVSNFHGSPRHFVSIEKACHDVSKATGMNMIPIFSLMLGRLNERGDSELGQVLGQLEGVTAEDFDGDTHGGLVETSQLLALHPDWVDPDYKELPKRTVEMWMEENGQKKKRADGRKLSEFPDLLRGFKAGLTYFTEETYTGQPGRASAELGEQILDLLAGRTAEALVEILEGKLDREHWHSPVWKLQPLFTSGLAFRFFNALLNVPKAVG